MYNLKKIMDEISNELQDNPSQLAKIAIKPRFPTVRQEYERIGALPPGCLYLATAEDGKPILMDARREPKNILLRVGTEIDMTIFESYWNSYKIFDTDYDKQIEFQLLSKSDLRLDVGWQKIHSLAYWVYGHNKKPLVFVVESLEDVRKENPDTYRMFYYAVKNAQKKARVSVIAATRDSHNGELESLFDIALQTSSNSFLFPEHYDSGGKTISRLVAGWLPEME